MSKRDRVFALRSQGYSEREISMELKISATNVRKVLNEGPQKPQAVTTKPHALKSVYRRMLLQMQLAALNERAKHIQSEIEALSAVEATGKVLQGKIEGARR